MSCVLKYLFTPGFILQCSSAIAADQMLLHPYLPYTYCKIYTPSYCSISKKINYSRGSGLASPVKEGLCWYNTGFCPHVMICEAICERPRQTKRQMTPNEKANVTSPMTPIKYRETPKSSGPSEGHHLPSSSWSSTHVAHVAYNHAKFSMVLCMHFEDFRFGAESNLWFGNEIHGFLLFFMCLKHGTAASCISSWSWYLQPLHINSISTGINSWNSSRAWNQPSESKHMLTFAPTNQGLISQRIPLQFSNSTRHLMDLSKHWMNTTRKIHTENTKWQQELSESTKKRNPPRCTRMTSSGFPKTL